MALLNEGYSTYYAKKQRWLKVCAGSSCSHSPGQPQLPPHQSQNLSLITFFYGLKTPSPSGLGVEYPTLQKFSPQALCRCLAQAGHILVQRNREMNIAVSFWVMPFGLGTSLVLGQDVSLHQGFCRTVCGGRFRQGITTLHRNTACYTHAPQ